jgi:hypothetical protein
VIIVPVGLFGLARKTSFVRSFAAASSASTEARRSSSGAVTGVAPAARADRVHQEPVLAVEHLVPRPGIGLAQKCDDLVRAAAADHPRRIEPVRGGDGGAQFGMVGGRVAVQVRAGVAQRRERGGRGTERVLVRAELEHLGMAGDAGLAAL